MSLIFVFGSNLAGRHGMGAAQHAFAFHGAVWGQGRGFHGRSYAIPTKDHRLRVLPLSSIAAEVGLFLEFAKAHPELEFQVTEIGTGLVGYPTAAIASFFKDHPANCHLPAEFSEWIRSKS